MENHENAISQNFAKKADEGLDMLCENGTITIDTIEKWERSICVFQDNDAEDKLYKWCVCHKQCRCKW